MNKKIATLLTITCVIGQYVNLTRNLLRNPAQPKPLARTFGLGKITLTYSRPNVKGRKMFGYTEPYGKVWRTGANSATILKLSDDVTMEGHKVAAGDYGLFSIPGKDKWTIILSKKPAQWGAYTYQQSDDYLRFDVAPVQMQDKIETFTMQFADVFPTSAQLIFDVGPYRVDDTSNL